MNKLMIAAVIAAVTAVGYADETSVPAVKPDKAVVQAQKEAARKANAEAKQKERLERREAALAARAQKEGITVDELKAKIAKKEAEFVGLSVEEWNKLDEAAKRQKRLEVVRGKRLEHEKKMAEKAGLSVEDWRKQQRAKFEEGRAKHRAKGKATCDAVKAACETAKPAPAAADAKK